MKNRGMYLYVCTARMCIHWHLAICYVGEGSHGHLIRHKCWHPYMSRCTRQLVFMLSIGKQPTVHRGANL